MDVKKLRKANELRRYIKTLKDDIDFWDTSPRKHIFDHTSNIDDDNIYNSFRTSVINDLKLKLIEAEKEFAEL